MVVPPPLTQLPDRLLRHILQGGTLHADLLRWVSLCARVCREWWYILRATAVYGRGLPPAAKPATAFADSSRNFRVPADLRAALLLAEGMPWESRDDILRVISRELRRSRAADARDGVSDSGLRLDFSNAANPVAKLGTEGCRVLGAALQACDVMVDDVNIAHCNIVPATLPLIFGTGLELTKLNLQGNDGLGDAGLVVLADLLPQSVTCLSFKSTRCGSVGMIAMSKALPKLVHLQFLDCSHTGPSGSLPVSHAALECLGRALPRLPELRAFVYYSMFESHVEWLAAAIAQCKALDLAVVGKWAEPDQNELRHAWGARRGELCFGHKPGPAGVSFIDLFEMRPSIQLTALRATIVRNRQSRSHLEL